MDFIACYLINLSIDTMYTCISVRMLKMSSNSDCHVTSGLTTFRITLLFIISDGSMCWAMPSSDITIFKAGRWECFLK